MISDQCGVLERRSWIFFYRRRTLDGDIFACLVTQPTSVKSALLSRDFPLLYIEKFHSLLDALSTQHT